MSLRDDLIEAMARAWLRADEPPTPYLTDDAIWHEWWTTGFGGDQSGLEQYGFLFGVVLDAMLDKLEEHADVRIADTSNSYQREVWLGTEPERYLIVPLSVLREKPQ